MGLDRQGRHTLIAAPTGSGKTLAAFLTAVNDLITEGQNGSLQDEVRVLYISPLTAVPSRETRDADVEMLARVLLRRYGVVFRRMLTREPAAPPWRELTRVYRRLEARGEVRGGDSCPACRASSSPCRRRSITCVA